MNNNTFSSASTVSTSKNLSNRRQRTGLLNNFCIFGQKLNQALQEERDSWTGTPLDFEFRLITWCRANTSLVFRYQKMKGQDLPAFTCYNNNSIERRSSSYLRSQHEAELSQQSRNIGENSSSQRSFGRISAERPRFVKMPSRDFSQTCQKEELTQC